MALELTGLAATRGGFEFGPVDLTVGGETLAVLGPSGSGKTTLLSLVAGIATPDSGSIALDGRELVGRPLEDRGVGLVFQEGALFPHLTARENVAYAAADPDRVEALAATLELKGVLDRRPAALSGGERGRVALARTLAADPDVLLLDEPLSSLDAPIRRRLRDQLADLFRSLSVPVVYVTHDRRTATALGDRIAVVRDGTVEQVGTPSAVIDRPESRFVARFTGTGTVLDGTVTARAGDDARVRVGGVELRVDAADLPASVGPGTAVAVPIHPSRVTLDAPGGDRAGPGPGGEKEGTAANALAGTVERRLNEGGEYRVAVDVADSPFSLAASVRPATVERLGMAEGDEVRALVPPGAVHPIPEE